MIRSVTVQQHHVEVKPGIAVPDPDIPSTWLHIVDPTDHELDVLKREYRIDASIQVEGIREDERYTYIPARLVTLCDDAPPAIRTITFVLGERVLATIDEHSGSPAFDKALHRIDRKPKLGHSPRTILRVVLQALNEAGEQLIDQIGDDLATVGSEIVTLSGTLHLRGKEIGVNDLTSIIMDLHSKEELISQCLERQIFLARAARRLASEVDSEEEPELASLIEELLADINGVKEHAAYEHDKVRYLQEAVNASLNIKQNEIVKIFTIISAVFLPPTLVASVYGMNWVAMPELNWVHGFPAAVYFMLLSAIVPLIYIRVRGWLR